MCQRSVEPIPTSRGRTHAGAGTAGFLAPVADRRQFGSDSVHAARTNGVSPPDRPPARSLARAESRSNKSNGPTVRRHSYRRECDDFSTELGWRLPRESKTFERAGQTLPTSFVRVCRMGRSDSASVTVGTRGVLPEPDRIRHDRFESAVSKNRSMGDHERASRALPTRSAGVAASRRRLRPPSRPTRAGVPGPASEVKRPSRFYHRSHTVTN